MLILTEFQKNLENSMVIRFPVAGSASMAPIYKRADSRVVAMDDHLHLVCD